MPHYVWCNNCPIKNPSCFFLESPARSVGILWLQTLAEGKSSGLINTVTCIVGSTVAISICIWSVNIVMGWWILAKSNNLQSIIMNTYTIQYNTRAIYTRKDKTRTVPFYTSMSYLIRRVLAKARLILDEMCRLYGKFASYLRRVLCKTRLIFPRINGPILCQTKICRR